MTPGDREGERGAFGSAEWRDYLALLFITVLVFVCALGLVYAVKKHMELRPAPTEEIDE